MQHSFDIEIAEKYGINIAIFLNNLAFWIKKNQANNKHFYNGRYWTYNSSRALSELFPYWSEDTIDRIIKKCIDEKLLIIDNFNTNKYDRTRWFAMTDEALELFKMAVPQNRGIKNIDKRDRFRENAGYINETDNKPDNKTDFKSYSHKKCTNETKSLVKDIDINNKGHYEPHKRGKISSLLNDFMSSGKLPMPNLINGV